MPRAKFDALVLELPPEAVDLLFEEARAGMLVDAIFKNVSEAEK